MNSSNAINKTSTKNGKPIRKNTESKNDSVSKLKFQSNDHEPDESLESQNSDDVTDELTNDYPFEKTDRNVVLSASKTVDNLDKFYGDGAEYWNHIPPTIDGMLGGYAKISPTDIMGSQAFLRQFINGRRSHAGTDRALDCGAGIGRITKRLLLPLFKTVDMVEQCQNFLDNAPKFIGSDSSRIGKFICTGLQDFTPDRKAYDVIWIQWVIGHLTDAHLSTFFKRCKSGLKDDGIIVLKENVTSGGDREFDKEDSSFTRSLDDIKSCIANAGLGILKLDRQRDFPKYLYNVHMIAIR